MDDEKILQGGKSSRELVNESSPMTTDLTILSCSTGNSGCAGVATFQNTGNQTASFTVWFQNGAQGRSNFVLQPRQTHGIHVRSGDTWSWVWGSTVVPDSTPRNWINVG
ncbi:hypothetical protein ABIA22_003208 [Sinorhizobium fredii]|uniref:hypothetical protein n=1 Tax=Rhizobium fredii TaxID=380 RepID=UPI003515397B